MSTITPHPPIGDFDQEVKKVIFNSGKENRGQTATFNKAVGRG